MLSLRTREGINLNLCKGQEGQLWGRDWDLRVGLGGHAATITGTYTLFYPGRTPMLCQRPRERWTSLIEAPNVVGKPLPLPQPEHLHPTRCTGPLCRLSTVL